MPQKRPRGRSTNLIETEAIIVAYAMSRLDDRFLRRFGFRTWRDAFEGTARRLGQRSASMKNLRDEFDPVHPNTRRGWHQRPLRPNRQRVLGEFCDASDEAVIEVVGRLLEGDRQIEELVTRPLAQARDRVENVAERLRTGRLAEEFFLKNSQSICDIRPGALVDMRLDCYGYDFGVVDQDIAIEVKGLKLTRGEIVFTDNEWNQANRRQEHYWLVVVGSLALEPQAKLIKHPAASLQVISSIWHHAAISWRAAVAVA